MMNKLIYTLVLGLLIISCKSNQSEHSGHEHREPEAATSAAEKSDNSKKSIPREAHGNVGDVHISMYYHSPAVRERVIWGGLVPFGEVWVTGAHSATNMEFSKAIKIAGTTIPKGKYAFFTIPGQDHWALILNKNWEQHLTDDYDQKEDVIRIEVTPETEKPLTERLTYTIEDKRDGSGTIHMSWEKLSVSLPFQAD